MRSSNPFNPVPLSCSNVVCVGDTYLMLLEFVVGFDGDWSNFDDNSAWPVVLDDYVDYLRENEIIE